MDADKEGGEGEEVGLEMDSEGGSDSLTPEEIKKAEGVLSAMFGKKVSLEAEGSAADEEEDALEMADDEGDEKEGEGKEEDEEGGEEEGESEEEMDESLSEDALVETVLARVTARLVAEAKGGAKKAKNH